MSTAKLYERRGFIHPWIGYLAWSGDDLAGTCAFTSPPHDGEVEIAYFTFPGFEGKGIATALARELVEIARSNDPGILVTARTLPRDYPSTTVLKKFFAFRGAVDHPTDGRIWRWELPHD